jgi:hypothetical protein
VAAAVAVAAPMVLAVQKLMRTSRPWRKPVEPAVTEPALVLVFVEEPEV